MQEKSGTNKNGEIQLLQSDDFFPGSGLHISNVSFDTLVGEDFKGIQLRFLCSTEDSTFIRLKQKNYQALFLSCSIENQADVLFKTSQRKENQAGQKIAIAKKDFLFSDGEKEVKFIFPFSCLNLQEGTFILSFKIEAFPVILSETGMHQYKKLVALKKIPLTQFTLNYKVTTPALSKNTILVKSFSIKNNSAPKAQFDFALTGKGLPDPYWTIKTAGGVVFSSKSVRNTLQVISNEKTPPFYTSKEDIITLTVIDFDQGPFNSKDILGQWSGTISELKALKGKFDFGKIVNFTFELEAQ